MLPPRTQTIQKYIFARPMDLIFFMQILLDIFNGERSLICHYVSISPNYNNIKRITIHNLPGQIFLHNCALCRSKQTLYKHSVKSNGDTRLAYLRIFLSFTLARPPKPEQHCGDLLL